MTINRNLDSITVAVACIPATSCVGNTYEQLKTLSSLLDLICVASNSWHGSITAESSLQSCSRRLLDFPQTV